MLKIFPVMYCVHHCVYPCVVKEMEASNSSNFVKPAGCIGVVCLWTQFGRIDSHQFAENILGPFNTIMTFIYCGRRYDTLPIVTRFYLGKTALAHIPLVNLMETEAKLDHSHIHILYCKCIVSQYSM